MNTKDYLLPLIIIPAGILFLVISAIVFFSNGRSARLIKYKLKLGAILLTLGWFTQLNAQHSNEIMCYKQPIDVTKEKEYKICKDVINGYIPYKGKFTYSYKLQEANSKKVLLEGELKIERIEKKSGKAMFSFTFNFQTKYSYDLYVYYTKNKKKTFLKKLRIVN